MDQFGQNIEYDDIQGKNEIHFNKQPRRQDSYFTKLQRSILSCLSIDQQATICEKYMTPELVSVFRDGELVDCVNAFFNNNLNISETSRNAFLHRNTLLYRIDKIHRITKLNIRNFEDAMTFKVLLLIYNKLGDKIGRN